MTDESFKNAIFGLFVILLILICIYFYNNSKPNDNVTANVQAEETQERDRNRVRKKVVKEDEKTEENNESEQLKELYREAFQNVFKNGIVTCHGYLENGEKIYDSWLDANNSICYYKYYIGSSEIYELYYYYSNGMFNEIKTINGKEEYTTVSGTSMNSIKGEDTVMYAFTYPPFLDKDFSLRYTYELEDDNCEVDGSLCYKIKCIVSDTSECTLCISKDSNLIIATQKPYDDNGVAYYRLEYNCEDMPISGYVRDYMNDEY